MSPLIWIGSCRAFIGCLAAVVFGSAFIVYCVGSLIRITYCIRSVATTLHQSKGSSSPRSDEV